MKWTELVDRVVLQFGTNPHNKAMARKFLEEAERDMAFYTKCFLKDKTIVANPDDNFFEMPNDFLELKSGITSNENQLQPYRDQINRVKVDGSQVKGTPRYYLLTSEQIILIPHPDSDQVINFQYVAQPKAVESDEVYRKINYKDLDNGFFQQGALVQGSRSLRKAYIHSDINDLKTGTLVIEGAHAGVHTYTSAYPVNPSSTQMGFSTNGNAEWFPASGTIALQAGNSSVNVTFTGRTISGNSVTITGAQIPSVINPGATFSVSQDFVQNETLFTIDDSYNLAQVSGSYTFDQLMSSWDEFGLGARATSSSVAIEWTDNDILSPVIPDIYHLYLCDYAKSCLAEQEKEYQLADRYMAKYIGNRESVRSQLSGKGTGSGTMVVADLSFRGNLV
jgi:hypothetical protein